MKMLCDDLTYKLMFLTCVAWITAQDELVGRPSRSALVDLLTDIARRELDFTYQVALPHMRDDNFRYSAVERYRKLLLLRRLRSREFSVTALPVDILLMLRVHSLHPTQFNVDMRRLFGDWASEALAIDWASLDYEAPDRVSRSSSGSGSSAAVRCSSSTAADCEVVVGGPPTAAVTKQR